MSTSILIVGAGRIGVAVARVLLDDHDAVTLLDVRPERLREIADDLPKATLIAGSGTDPAVLESAGIRSIDAVAAVTGLDETNLLATSLARFEFDVPRTIGRIVDPSKAWMYTSVMGVDVALNQANLVARLVAEELSLGEMTTLLKLRQGQYDLVEERIHPQARAAHRAVRDLPLPAECVLVAVLREGSPILTRGDVVLLPGDEVLAVVHSGQASVLAALLGSPA